MTGHYAYRRERFPWQLWRAIVTGLALVLLSPLLLAGSPVLTEEWFCGRGPRWWHWLRGEL